MCDPMPYVHVRPHACATPCLMRMRDPMRRNYLTRTVKIRLTRTVKMFGEKDLNQDHENSLTRTVKILSQKCVNKDRENSLTRTVKICGVKSDRSRTVKIS